MAASFLLTVTALGLFLAVWEFTAWRTGRLPLITFLAQRSRLLAVLIELVFVLAALWWPIHLVTGG